MSFVSGSLLAMLVPRASEAARQPASKAAQIRPAGRVGPRGDAGDANSPAGVRSAPGERFDQLPASQQAEAIRRLNARLQGPPSPSDLRVVFEILEPLDWAACAQLWKELFREGENVKTIHPELLQIVAEHLAKADPKTTLALAGEPDGAPGSGRGGRLQLLRAALSALLHRDAAEAARALIELPSDLQKESFFQGSEDDARLVFSKIGGSFASVLQVVEENPRVLLRHEFTPCVLAALAYEETHSISGVIEKLRFTAQHLAETFSGQLTQEGKGRAEQAYHFEERFVRGGMELLTRMQPIPLDPLALPDEDKGPAGMLMALKAFHLGLSEDVNSVVSFLKNQSREGADESLKIGAFAGACIRDAAGMLRALEDDASSPTLKREFFECIPVVHSLLINGSGDGSVSTEDVTSIAADLQLPASLALEFYAYQLGRRETFFDFTAPKGRGAPNGMFIESLPLPEPWKLELHKQFHAIPLEK
jgi:hypothetical protein